MIQKTSKNIIANLMKVMCYCLRRKVSIVWNGIARGTMYRIASCRLVVVLHMS